MATQRGSNVSVVSIHGNFDDAQRGVKELFGDRDLEKQLLEKGIQLSSANSINIGRLIPQIVYYVSAYVKLRETEEIAAGEAINLCVPTGNFGNILAAYLAKRMGLPVGRLICASNENKVLCDFFRSGRYDKNRRFILTTSPSMDILVSSNLERLIYLSCGEDAAINRGLMRQLKENGVYSVTEEMRAFMQDFIGGSADEKEVAARIRSLYEETGYVIDTHTAVASAVYEAYRRESGDSTKTVIASTASPFKFARAVLQAIQGEVQETDDWTVIELLQKKAGIPIPKAVTEIRHARVLHRRECDAADMKREVSDILKL